MTSAKGDKNSSLVTVVGAASGTDERSSGKERDISFAHAF
jgi:hypothetical protein